MNELSLDELKDIEYALETVYLGNSTLRNKIQSMIKDYQCSHESDGLIYTSNPPQNKCVKCKEFY